MVYDNKMKLIFSAKSENESFARVAVAAFVAQLDPLVSDVSDIKTAVSEAVTNAIIHGYEGKGNGEIILTCGIKNNKIFIEVNDNGVGIKDIILARQPLFTSKPNEERSGMGFTVMETFMDEVSVFSEVGKGTLVHMSKKLLH